MYRILFTLLHSALWGIPVKDAKLTPEQFAKLLRISEKQTVEGLIMKALMDNNVHLEKHDAVECFTLHEHVAEMNRKITEGLHALCNLLQPAELPFVVVKGQTFLPLYSNGKSRVPGDIDFYCPAESYDKAKALITEQWQVNWEADEDETVQHYACQHNGAYYEMHFCLKKFYSSKSQYFFDRLIDDTPYTSRVIDGCEVPVLQPHLEVLFTFLHLYHHLVGRGVALRQFCDLAILMDKVDYDFDLLHDALLQTDHLRAFKAVGAVLVDVLGLPEERFPYPLSKQDYAYVKRLMEIVVHHGNFGLYGNKHHSRSGWKYYREALGNKLSAQWQFYRLAPRESRNTLLRAIPQKVFFAARRQNRK